MKKYFLIGLFFIATIIVQGQTITGISPSSASAGQTLNVTITGSGTHFGSVSNTTLSFGFAQCSGSVVNSLTVNNITSLTANITVPLVYTNLHDVQIYNVSDGYVVGDHMFNVTNGSTYPISISPNSAAPGQTLNVSITGTGTHFTQNSGTVKVDLDLNQRFCLESFDSFNANVLSNTLMTANLTIPATADTGYYDLDISGTSDYFGWLPNLFRITSPLAVNALENEYHFSVSPNPFSSTAHVNYQLSNQENVLIEIYDLYSRKVMAEPLGKQSSGQHAFKIDAAALNLPIGIYYLRFSAGNRSIIKKILIIK